MKTYLKGYLKRGILLLGISIFLVNCQKEDDIENIDPIDESQKITSKIVSAKDVPNIINFIKSKSNNNLEFIIKEGEATNPMQMGREEDLTLTRVLTNQINQVTNSDGRSNYTFGMTTQRDRRGTYFINLVVKEYLDTYYISIIKYVPDAVWLRSDQDFSTFSGDMYFYDAQGTYLANLGLSGGVSTSFGYNPPCPGGGNGDWIGEGGIGGSGLGDIPCIQVFVECGGTNSSTPHTPEECGAESGTGSYWTVCEEDDTGYDGTGNNNWINNFNNYLQDPCGNIGSGGGRSDCSVTCEFPLELDANCNCVEAKPLENTNIGIIINDVAAMKNINKCLDRALTTNQIDWLLDDDNEASLFELNDYINDNNCSEEAKDFAELAIEALIEGGEVDFENQTINYVKPCPGDPVPNPEIAPQYGNSGTKGALHGCTRYGGSCTSSDGRTKPHAGIDLKSDYGDPIYAMFDGFIYNTLHDEDAGYFTQIQSTVNGETIISKYFHLQQENRIRENSDGILRYVSAGDIIGYQGDSGNLKGAIANKTVESHVHIEILLHDGSSNWNYFTNFSTVDPRDYLSTTINDNGVSQTNTNCN